MVAKPSEQYAEGVGPEPQVDDEDIGDELEKLWWKGLSPEQVEEKYTLLLGYYDVKDPRTDKLFQGLMWYEGSETRARAEFKRRLDDRYGGRGHEVHTTDPYQIAKRFLDKCYSMDGIPTLWYDGSVYWHWRAGVYVACDRDDVKHKLYVFLAEYCRAYDHAKIKPDQKLVGKVMDPIPGMCKLPSDQRVPCWLDGRVRPAPRDMISCANGLLNTNTKELMKHTPAYFTLTMLNFDYDPEAPVPERWLKFLEEVWPGDAESQGALQEMFGYYLTADTSQQKAHVMIGPKRSGKGTIAYILELLLGEGNTAGPLITSLGRQFGMEPLIGKTLAIIPDARVSNRTDTAPIVEALLAITGEDKVSVSRKNKTDWHGRLGTRLLILSNKVPDTVDEGGVLPTRLIVLDMKVSFFGREDIGLKDVLKEEVPGIMNWSLDGLRSLRERGRFVQPEAGMRRLGDIEDMTAPGPSFVRDRLIVTSTASVMPEEVWMAWQEWCEEKEREPGTKPMMGKMLRETLGDKISDYRPRDKNMPDGRGMRRYRGIALRYQE